MRTPSNIRLCRNARAFMFMDLMIALAIAALVLLSLSEAMGMFRKAERGLADARADSRRLEQGLLTLQTGDKLDPDLRAQRLGNGPANQVWVRLSLPPGPLPRNQTSAALVGLVPADKAAGGVP